MARMVIFTIPFSTGSSRITVLNVMASVYNRLSEQRSATWVLLFCRFTKGSLATPRAVRPLRQTSSTKLLPNTRIHFETFGIVKMAQVR